MLRPGTVPDDREVCSGVPTTGWRGEGGSNPVVDPKQTIGRRHKCPSRHWPDGRRTRRYAYVHRGARPPSDEDRSQCSPGAACSRMGDAISQRADGLVGRVVLAPGKEVGSREAAHLLRPRSLRGRVGSPRGGGDTPDSGDWPGPAEQTCWPAAGSSCRFGPPRKWVRLSQTGTTPPGGPTKWGCGMGVNRAPALDEDAFARLRREIGNDQACADFIEIFLDLLPRRLHDLSTGLASGQRPWEPATNLAATCRMLGARALAEHLEELEEGSEVVASPECRRAHLAGTFALVRPLRIELRRQQMRLRTAGPPARRTG